MTAVGAVIESGSIDLLVDWALLLRDNELASAEQFWTELEETDRVILLSEHFGKRLASFGIDPKAYHYSLATSNAEHVFCYELFRTFDSVATLICDDRPEWIDELQSGLWMFSQLVALRLEKAAERSRRAAVSAVGARVRGEKKTDWKDKAITLFDPGPGTGSKAHRSRIIRKRAIEAGFRDADKLPKRLDKDLPD